MFAWLKRKKVQSDPFDIFYPPAEREIYGYWNGKEVVKADPMILWKKIMAVGPELSIDIKVSNSPSKDAAEADNEVVRKVRDVFAIPSHTDGGLTENGCKELLDHFLEFCETLKKNWNLSSNSSNDSEPETPKDQITLPGLAYGSTVNVPSIVKPPSSPMESQSASV